MKHFVPSLVPAEGLGVLSLFQLVDEAVPAFFRPDRTIHVARAPGRLDVLGGFADYSGSLALQLPTAEAACVALQRREDDLVRLWSPCDDGSRTQLLSMRLADLGLPAAPMEYAEARAFFRADPNDRDGDGISGRTAFRGYRHMPWSRIVDSRFCLIGWLTLRARDGTVLRVPRMVRGFHVLSEIARRNARSGIQEDLLVATEVWGR